ncbi:MAG: hypothetical protein ACJA1R_000447 [Flavobacteriales bacterium]|jgi:hypothetical protein
MMSPYFLYRMELGTPQDDGTYVLDAWERASVLSYTLWGTMPDERLLDAAARGDLDTPAGMRAEAARLLDGPQAREGVAMFTEQWLGIEAVEDATRDHSRYPGFNGAARAALREETRRLVTHVIFDGTGKLPELYDADYTIFNAALSRLYGWQEQPDGGQLMPYTDDRECRSASACFVRQYVRFSSGREETPADLCTLRDLEREFASADPDIRELMLATATHPSCMEEAFTMRRRTSDRRTGLTCRQLLQRLGGAAVALPFASLLYGRDAAAMDGVSRRLIVFCFPDGVPGASANGDPSLWHATGSEFGFSLPETVSPLEAWRDRCVFTSGLSMGPADEGSHPGGAKKLLTAVDGGGGASLDHVLAQTVGASSPYRHLYLGAHANQNGASGDRHLTYVALGVTTPPQDDPRRAFESLFAGASGATEGGQDLEALRRLSVIDRSRDELATLRTQLDGRDQGRLDLHLESFREVEQRRWFVDQFAYLLQQLENQPEGEGTMLDYSTVLLCSEVSDGNLHTHSDMPFILAGGGAGSIRTGRFLDFGG